ncbi:alpha-(1,3)-fucosyltransferase C-like [Cydia amplana]|uniref:alpha-(1,3)-fucosyltransferase C-like n=1 Tax=Cydia amplana TaxID=1869771 RepID=UPI002FE6B56D
MSQILKAVLFAAYAALLIHFLKLLRTQQKVIEIEYIVRPPGSYKKIMREIKKITEKSKSKYQYTVFDKTFEQPLRLPADLRYILKWTQAMTHYSNPDFINGQRPFLDNDCPVYNCFMTNDKGLLQDPRYFDAILFDVENNWDYHPNIRALHQKYIFTASEPAGLFPVCEPLYNNYYNWTWSYRLDSTIPQPFFNIYFKNGTIAGPQLKMQWLENSYTLSQHIKSKLKRKTKLAAWFVSHCKTKSKRENLASDLNKYLEMYNFTIDIYGLCGKHACPKDDLNTCLQMLQTEYYFYLAFENSLDEDYVTEKVLNALNYYTVPIVYGGADYSRFLPPDSYIDANKMTPAALASMMIEISKDPATYYAYFGWHRNYTYKANSLGSHLCRLCEMLNDPHQPSELRNFTQWWNTEGNCQEKVADAKELNSQISSSTVNV